MIGNHLKVRQIMAENGYEYTPVEAKHMVDDFNHAMDRLTTYESYLIFSNMEEQDMIDELAHINESGEEMTLDDFKEIRDFILDTCEHKF